MSGFAGHGSSHVLPSTLHSSTALGSVVKLIVAEVWLVGLAGMPLMPTSAGALVSTVNVETASGPRLPATSTWRTLSVWTPSMSGSVVKGLVQGAHAPPSTWHSKVVVPSPVKVKVGVVSAVAAGMSPMAGGSAGAVVSMVHSWRATGPALPAVSSRRASMEWVPSARPARVTGLAQVVQPPPSIRHWKVVPGSPVSVADRFVLDVMVLGTPLMPGAEAGGTVSTAQVTVTGGLALPAASNSRTLTTWVPLESPERVTGLAQGAQAPPSMRHSKVSPDSAALIVRPAEVWLVGLTGRLPTVGAAGATVSTIHVVLVMPLTLPAASSARSCRVCDPSARPSAVKGDEHGVHEPESSLHSKVVPGSALRFTLTDVALVAPEGAPETSGSPGDAVSTVISRARGVPPLPAWSTVRTSKVCAPSLRRAAAKGLMHAVKGSPSTLHSYDSSCAAPVKAHVGVGSLVGPFGPLVMVGIVLGGSARVTQVRVASGPRLPAASTSATRNVWVPLVSWPDVNGLVHAA